VQERPARVPLPRQRRYILIAHSLIHHQLTLPLGNRRSPDVSESEDPAV
jgi:hypothetical protein